MSFLIVASTWSHGPKRNPANIVPQTPILLARGHLSGLIQRIRGDNQRVSNSVHFNIWIREIPGLPCQSLNFCKLASSHSEKMPFFKSQNYPLLHEVYLIPIQISEILRCAKDVRSKSRTFFVPITLIYS